MKTCPGCGHQNEGNNRFCATCGFDLYKVPPQASPSGAAPQVGPAVLRALGYRVAITCPECLHRNPVNQLRPTMLCHTCQAVTDLARSGRAWWLHDIVANHCTHAALARVEGEVGHAETSEFRVEFCRGLAACPGCRRQPTPAEFAAAAAAGEFRCGTCAYVGTCRTAEPSLAARFPPARWLLGEAPEAGVAPQGSSPVMVACLSCGAGLRVDGTNRMVQCTYCGMSNYLPDGLWLRLHPAQRLTWFYLIVETAG